MHRTHIASLPRGRGGESSCSMVVAWDAHRLAGGTYLLKSLFQPTTILAARCALTMSLAFLSMVRLHGPISIYIYGTLSSVVHRIVLRNVEKAELYETWKTLREFAFEFTSFHRSITISTTYNKLSIIDRLIVNFKARSPDTVASFLKKVEAKCV